MLLWVLDKLHAQKLKLVDETAHLQNSHVFTKEWKHGFLELDLGALMQLRLIWSGFLVLN